MSYSKENFDNYRVLLKSNDGVLIGQIQNKITTLAWEWNRIGGCGGCKMKVKTEWDSALASSFSEDYQVEIYVPNIYGTQELWYGGYVDKVSPVADSKGGYINVTCLGYVNQLKRVVINDTTYKGLEIGNCAKIILEDFAVPITDITTVDSDYDDTKFSADTLYFNESAYEAIIKLAGIAGRREWGVRADKSFFFKDRDNNVTRIYNLTEDFLSWKPVRDYNPIITRIYLFGGKNYSQRFTVTNRITTREKVVSNSAITTQSVGQQYARMYLKEHGIPKRSYVGKVAKKFERIEETIPIGLASVNAKRGIQDKYDVATNLYDSGIKYDGGTESYQIEKIKYQITDDGVNVSLNFGPIAADLVSDLKQLEYQINMEKNL